MNKTNDVLVRVSDCLIGNYHHYCVDGKKCGMCGYPRDKEEKEVEKKDEKASP